MARRPKRDGAVAAAVTSWPPSRCTGMLPQPRQRPPPRDGDGDCGGTTTEGDGDDGVPTAARTTGNNRHLCPARPGVGVSAYLGGCAVAAVVAAAVAPVVVPGAVGVCHKNRPYGSVAFPDVRCRTLYEQTQKRFKNVEHFNIVHFINIIISIIIRPL